MVLIDQVVVGIGILLLLAILVVIKQVSTGSVLDKPRGDLLVQPDNIFNLVFLLIANPLAAVALITRSLPRLDPTHVTIHYLALILALIPMEEGEWRNAYAARYVDYQRKTRRLLPFVYYVGI